MTVRITLNGEDFQTLVNGGTVKTRGWNTEAQDEDTAEIILQDIGFQAMRLAIPNIPPPRQ
jgi:hypothetical protein